MSVITCRKIDCLVVVVFDWFFFYEAKFSCLDPLAFSVVDATDKGFGLACLLLELSRRSLLVGVLFPVCPVDQRRVAPAMTLQSWSRWS